MSRNAVVIISSSRAAAGVYEDRTGPLIQQWLDERGFSGTQPVVVADGAPFVHALRSALGAELVITSGGTGLTPSDLTPELTAGVVERQIPGIAEAIRSRGVASGVASAMLSRGIVGVAGSTLIVNLPGSRGGVRDGLAVLGDVLEHVLDQIAGGDHERHADPGEPDLAGQLPSTPPAAPGRLAGPSA